MSDIIVDTYKLNEYAGRIAKVNNRIDKLDGDLDRFYKKVGLLDLPSLIFANALTRYSWRLDCCRVYLQQTARDFEEVERALLKQDPANFDLWVDSSAATTGNAEGWSGDNGAFGVTKSDTSDIHENIAKGLSAVVGATSFAKTSDGDERSWFARFINNDIKTAGSVLSGEKTGESELWGVSVAGTVSGALLTGEAGIKSRASWKFKDKDGKWDFSSFGISTEAKASGAAAKGEAEGNLGYLHGKVSGKAITGAVKGETKFTLFDDGEFNPSISLNAKAEGSVLQGDAEVGFGTDQYGVFAKADGDLLHGEAKAKVGVGYLDTDKDGNATYGASAEVSAMASVAQGKAKGGITVFGVDIDVGVKGYAVAAGVEAGGSITTDGVTATFGGALGLGAGMDISVDWSDAEWIGDTIDAVGDFVSDATEVVGSAVEYVGDAAEDFFEDVADAADGAWDFLFGRII